MKLFVLFGLLAILGSAALDIRDAQLTKVNDFVLVIEEKADEENNDDKIISLQTDAGIQEMSLDEYLVGVVLTEMPASFELEAMKAQAVAARTYAIKTHKHEGFDICTDSGCCQAWRSQSALRQAFGSDYAKIMEKGTAAVQSTKGQALYYGDDLIDAVYFSCSGGMSEPAVAVWGTEVPYLQAVQSPGEEDSTKFYSEVRYSFSEFQDKLRTAEMNTKFTVIPHDWIGEATYSAGGGVASMELAGVTFTGTKLRSIFSLPSTKFSLKVEGGEIVFRVHGYGHRVGMSQYGANAMAAAGSEYTEILKHYYTGVTIKKLSRS